MGFWWSCCIFNFLHGAILKRLSIAPIIHYLYLFFSLFFLLFISFFLLCSPAEQVVSGCWMGSLLWPQAMYGSRIGPAASYTPQLRWFSRIVRNERNHSRFETQFIAEVWSKFTENLHCSLIKQSLWEEGPGKLMMISFELLL